MQVQVDQEVQAVPAPLKHPAAHPPSRPPMLLPVPLASSRYLLLLWVVLLLPFSCRGILS